MRWLLVTLIFALVFISCDNKKDAPDVSHIKVDITIHRFDKDFFSIDTTQVEASLENLRRKYPSFLPMYFEYFSPVDFIVRNQQQDYATVVRDYFTNIQPLYDSVEKKIKDVSEIEEGLEQSFRYVKYYYPSFKIPAVITTVESLNPENPMEIYGTTYYHDSLFISLQMFLGKNFSVYDPAHYPDYLRRRFEPEFIVPNSLRAIANELYSDSSEGAPLIERMIEKGKQWYVLSKFLPNTPDSLITGYSQQQMEWCKKEEANIWGYINQNENLFSIEQQTIQTYIGEAPFTQTLPHNTSGGGAPGNIGPWIGWRIVEAFAEKNPKLTVQQVLARPARKIFQEAKYRPK